MPSSGTRYSQDDVLNHILGIDGGTPGSGSAGFAKVGGNYTENPTATTSGRDRLLWLDAQGYIMPHLKPLQLDGATTASGSATGTTKSGLGAFRDMDIVVVCSLGTGTSATMDLYLDTRLDGTNYNNLAHLAYTQAGTNLVHLSKRQASVNVDGSADAGAGTVRAIGWGDDIRVRRNITGTSPSFTYQAWIVAVS